MPCLCDELIIAIGLLFGPFTKTTTCSEFSCSYNLSRYDHITPVLRSLPWLPIEYRISFKVLIITFKAIHGATPEYLSNLISKMCTYSLRSNAGIPLELPSTRLRKL